MMFRSGDNFQANHIMENQPLEKLANHALENRGPLSQEFFALGCANWK